LNCPLDEVRPVLAEHDAQSKRQRDLPHEVLVYFVMARVLYGQEACEEVRHPVLEGLRPILGDEGVSRASVSKGALSQVRRQVGSAPPPQLYQEPVRSHGPAQMPGVLCKLAGHDPRRFHPGEAR
jgi:hypothetical protein